MPRRTREHQLEGESRLAFERALGSRFVFRSEDPDYGVDGSVEEFDTELGQATGLRFFAQLKATDEAVLAKALHARISLETADYYRALSLPLLMVRYHAPTNRTFTRWFHQFDPYFGGLGDKGLTFRWVESDVWDGQRPERLVADVQAFLRWRSPSLPLPVTVRRDCPAEGALGLSGSEIRVGLQRRAEDRPDVLRFGGGSPEPGEALVEVTDDQIAGALGTVTRAVLHLDSGYDPGPSGDQIAVDAYVMVALAFENVGQDDIAGRLAAAYFAESTLTQAFEPALALSAAMARGRRVLEALDLAERLDVSDDPSTSAASFAFTLPALAHGETLSGRELKDYRGTMRARIARRHERGDLVGAARESYGLGNHFRNRESPHEALQLYKDAGRLEPAYLQRAHYWFELGGVFFFAQYYSEAADAYERALGLGADSMAAALKADSLMFQGEYAEAHELFESFNRDSAHHENPRFAEYRLKEFVLRLVINERAISRQDRQPELAERLSGSVGGDLEPGAAAASLDKALDLDALCGLAWFNRGTADRLLGATERVFVDYLIAAVLQPWDPEAWGNVVVLAAFSESAPYYLGDILVTARRQAGESNVVDWVIRTAKAQSEAFPHQDFVAMIQGMFDELPAEEQPGFTLRSLGAGGAVDETFLSVHSDEAYRRRTPPKADQGQ